MNAIKLLITLLVVCFVVTAVYYSKSISKPNAFVLHTKPNIRLETSGPAQQFKSVLHLEQSVQNIPLPTKRCDINLLIITSPREIPGSSKFFYLQRTLRSIVVDLKVVYLDVCTYVFSTRGVSVESELKEAIHASGLQDVIILNKEEDSNIYGEDTFIDSPKKRRQANDFYDMFKTFSKIHTNGLVVLMEDDFEFCENSFGHIMNILSRAKDKKWTGIRFSFGLNGVVIDKNDIPMFLKYMEMNRHQSYPVDWLFEEFLHKKTLFASLHFGSRNFITYRYQLMRHIGVSTSVGNERTAEDNSVLFPHCYELQSHSGVMVQFNIQECPHSSFYPCPEEGKQDPSIFRDDTRNGDEIPASSEYGISELHKVNAILCEKGEDCNSCCRTKNATCDGRFFHFINKCEEMRKHFPNCQCADELVALESRAPNFDGEVCVMGRRRSRFRCEKSYRTERRLCPCYSNDLEK